MTARTGKVRLHGLKCGSEGVLSAFANGIGPGQSCRPVFSLHFAKDALTQAGQSPKRKSIDAKWGGAFLGAERADFGFDFAKQLFCEVG